MNKDLVAIFEYLEREKGIKREVVISAIEDSLRIAARKSIKDVGDIEVTINPKTGDIEANSEKEIVEHVEYPDEEVSLQVAREIDPDCEVGQWIQVEVDPSQLGRIAAQTARQVITQKLRGAERDVIYEEYRHRINELVTGVVKRVGRGPTVIVDLGKVEAVMPARNFPKTEKYEPGEKVLALLYEVRDTENGGAEVVLSRSHPEMVVQLFEQEVPELHDGLINIQKIVREAGYRTKMAVDSPDIRVDPVGACVGVRGTRVKNIIRELNNEKIDVMPYSSDPIVLLKNAISPVEIRKIDVDEEGNLITIVIDDEDYPAVIGRKGINARLTGDLIGYELKVYKATEYEKQASLEMRRLSLSEDSKLDSPLNLEGVNQLVLDTLISSGFDTPRKVLSTDPSEIAKQTDISLDMIKQILEKIAKSIKPEGQDATTI